MESAQSFLAAIQWVYLLPIRETKSHSRGISPDACFGLRLGEHPSIAADALHSEHVWCRASALAEMESAQGFLCHLVGLAATDP